MKMIGLKQKIGLKELMIFFKKTEFVEKALEWELIDK